jgi:putative ABC transport system permease protein
MRSWVTALRIARREVQRAKGRSALVVALIGLPVLGFAFVAVLHDTFTLTAAERMDRELGRADVAVGELWTGPVKQVSTELIGTGQGRPRDATAEDIRRLLPAASRMIATRVDVAEFRTATGRGQIETLELDYADPLAAGIIRPLAGRAPRGPDEVALSAPAQRRAGVGIGGTLTTPDGSRSWRVVGLVEDPQNLRREVIVARPDALPRGDGQAPRTRWLVDTPDPVDWRGVLALNRAGAVAVSRAVVLDPPPFDPATMLEPVDTGGTFATGTALAGTMILEVVLLAGPAFAVGARRRRRDLALVAAAGGSPAHLRRIVLADGILLGTLAALAGLAVGVVAAVASHGLVAEHVANARPGALRVFPAALAGLVGLAVLAGVLAALVPAWTAARQPVVAALAGRYATARLRRRWALLGLVVIGAGAGVAVLGARRAAESLVLGGLVIGEIGLVLCTPALVGFLARLGGPLPVSLRIALRDIGRNRAAAAPAISAVLAAVAVSTLAGAVFAGSNARYAGDEVPLLLPDGFVSAQPLRRIDPDAPRPPDPDPAAFDALAAAMRNTMPVTGVVPVGRPACTGTGAGAGAGDLCDVVAVRPADRECPYLGGPELSKDAQRRANRDPRCEAFIRDSRNPAFQTAVIDPADLGRLLRLDAATRAHAESVLRAGGALVADRHAVVDGSVTLHFVNVTGERVGPLAFRVRTGDAVTVPAVAIPDADSPALVVSPATVAKVGGGVVPAGLVGTTDRTPTQAEEDAFSAAAASIEGGWIIGVQRPGESRPDVVLIVLALAAGAVTIGAAAIATGLAAAEGRADLATLGAVGASPGVRRLLSLSRTGIVAGLGSALGVVAGLGAAAALVSGVNAGLAVVWPPTQPPLPFVVPWGNVALSLVVVPAVAMLGAGLLTRSPRSARRCVRDALS